MTESKINVPRNTKEHRGKDTDGLAAVRELFIRA